MGHQAKNDNAANRESYVGEIYNVGEKATKETILGSLKPKWADFHRNGYIHIHDLDAYGLTYNCLTFDILTAFPYKDFTELGDVATIVRVFDFLKELLAKMGNEQSGGMSFANFDIEIAAIFSKLGISHKGNEELFHACIRSLILWCNNIHTRMGQTSYYVTFNLGLGVSDFERFITKSIIDNFYNAGDLIYKPNIVFKTCSGINRRDGDPNYDLLVLSLKCTAKKMIPTYLLCDCEMDQSCDPLKLSIMGCRTRVVDDVFGEPGAIGRGNIDNITINLPRLALETARDYPSVSLDDRIRHFKNRWTEIADVVKEILLDRYEKTLREDLSLFPTNCEYKLWCRDMSKVGVSETLKHGTLSIGFIGLTETIEVLTGNKFWKDGNSYKVAMSILEMMRCYVDRLRDKYQLNFSLLATSGELISGRFVELDKKEFKASILRKGYYTNSFHVDVNSQLPAYEKLKFEGPFHKYANGGCISYVELEEAPLDNAEGLKELLDIACDSGVHYLGFNFPKDICNECRSSGVFDCCPKCDSTNITRIRRVSGYLEVLGGFTKGKKAEEMDRKSN